MISMEIQAGYPTVWDCELDVATGPKLGALAKDAEWNWMHGENRKRKRAKNQEDISMTEIVDINYQSEITACLHQVQTKSYSNTYRVPTAWRTGQR